MRLHLNNKPSKQVRVYRQVKVSFSVGGTQYNEATTLTRDYAPDTLSEYARYVDVLLDHHVGQFVKVQLYFDADWIMLSEVGFESGEFRSIVLLFK